MSKNAAISGFSTSAFWVDADGRLRLARISSRRRIGAVTAGQWMSWR